MKIICLGCGHKLDLTDSYGDYDGPVRCNVCRSVMKITSEGGKLKTSCLLEGLNIGPAGKT